MSTLANHDIKRWLAANALRLTDKARAEQECLELMLEAVGATASQRMFPNGRAFHSSKHESVRYEC